MYESKKTATSIKSGAASDNDDSFVSMDLSLCKINCEIFQIMVPITIAYLFQQAIYSINAIYVGKYGDPSMVAGLELGSTCLECPTLYVIWGMNGALATLVSSAYGAGELQLCG